MNILHYYGEMINFFGKVFTITKKIPSGRVSTYGSVAMAFGNKNLARRVGYVLSKNTDPENIPCHRVICSDGRLGGYRWGVLKKAELLVSEGIRVKSGYVVDPEDFLMTADELRQ